MQKRKTVHRDAPGDKGRKYSCRKNAVKRPIAMLLVFAMFWGLVPESAASWLGGALEQVWASDIEEQPVDQAETNTIAAYVDNFLLDDDIRALINAVPEHVTAQSKGLQAKEDSSTIYWDLADDVNAGNLVIEPGDPEVYWVYSSLGNENYTSNTITVEAGVEAIIYMEDVYIYLAGSNTLVSPIYVKPGAILHLVLVDGSENIINVNLTSGQSDIRVPKGAELILYSETEGSGQPGKLTFNSRSTYSAVIGGTAGNGEDTDYGNGEEAGKITIHGGVLNFAVNKLHSPYIGGGSA